VSSARKTEVTKVERNIEKVRHPNLTVRFRVRWRDPSGKRIAKTFDTRKQAQDFLTKINAAKLTSSYVDPAHGKVLVRDQAQAWLAGRDVRPSTAARDDSYFRSIILPHFGEVPIGQVRAADVARWKMELLGSKSPATVSKALTLFKMLLNDAVRDGLLPANPIAGVKLPTIEREEMRFLTPGELLRLADAIDARYRALIFVGGYGGLRIGELAGLRRSRIDMLRGVIDVADQVVEVEGRLSVGPLKTRAARRRVKLPCFVVEELAAHLAKAQGELVFPSPEGGLLSRTRFRTRVWLPATRAAGLDGVRVHDLRHTAVSLWIATGANPKEVARRAGHTSVRTVFDVYGHLLPDSDDALVNALDALGRRVLADSAGTGRVLELGNHIGGSQ
jgi:integrase